MSFEMMDVVNDDNQVIGRASRDEIYRLSLPHRVVHIFVFNDQGELALQRRSAEVYAPLHWGISAAGHVSVGERPVESARRELLEELDVRSRLVHIGEERFLREDPIEGAVKKFISVFRTNANGPFKIDRTEVESVNFFSLSSVQEMIKSGEPFTGDLLFMLAKRFGIKHSENLKEF